MSGVMKKILIRETAGIARCGEVVRVSVPCARGDFKADQPLSVSGPDCRSLAYQSKVLKQWPDGSAKWLLIDFAATVEAGCCAEYYLTAGDTILPTANSVQVKTGSDSWQVDTGKATFIIDARVFRPFAAVKVKGKEVLRPAASVCLLALDGQDGGAAAVDAITLEESGPLHAVVRLAGQFKGAPNSKAHFFCRLHFLAGSSAAKIEFTIHNPAAARHSGGLWDLGDVGSLLFRSLVFSFFPNHAGEEITCFPAPRALTLAIPSGSDFSLYQESSGGENWRSPVHRNREGGVPMERCGYVAAVDGQEVSSGLRATPLLWQGSGDEGIAAAVPFFWQEFPGEIAVGDGSLRVVPFPARFPDLHELQGGEQRTHEFWVDFATSREGLNWALQPVMAHAAPAVNRESGVFHDLPGDNDLVDSFTSATELLNKRETADEYGWRNFGEIYADHEAVSHQGPELFVSHYNNQYDFIAGLYRKFFATGDIGWRDLAGDLSKHVRSIDLYHTDQDREEYNHGLFWHTDHYVDAGLSAHRSFSKDHLKVKPPHLCGGGPGAEHCYTTGLMLHYFQTGDPDYKEAVIALAQWELLALTGPQTVLAALKRGMGNINSWRAGKGQGLLFPRYPLTRGTGNAITACLDAFEVGAGRSFLDKADEFIRGALNPEDDIAVRNLLNAEAAWSYTVLLSSVAKYLDKKSELGELDTDFDYARASLLAYADWMLNNEYPFLDKPEILEYPNETWAAQDLRKSSLFYQAAKFANSSKQQSAFLEKARFFYRYSSDELEKHSSSRFTRPIVLMLQNGWVGSQLDAPLAIDGTGNGSKNAISGAPIPLLSLGTVATRLISDVCISLRQTSISREVAWLRARMSN